MAQFPTDWYWFVGADTARVYSTLVAGYVPTSNEAFAAFRLAEAPSRIVSEGELADVLANFGIGFVTGPAPVPTSVSIERAELALSEAGYLDAVEAYFDDPQTPKRQNILYARRTVAERFGLLSWVLAETVGLTSGQIDDLFRSAVTVEL